MDQDDEAVPEITSGDQLEMRFTDLSDNETGSDTEGEGDRSEMINGAVRQLQKYCRLILAARTVVCDPRRIC